MSPTDMQENGAEAEWTALHGANDSDRLAAIARREAINRKQRNNLIRYDFSAEPAWDMLLALYIRRHDGQAIDAESLCAAAATSQTSALRAIGLLIETGFVSWSQPAPGEHDVQIALSDAGAAEIERYLRDILHRAKLGRDMAGPRQNG